MKAAVKSAEGFFKKGWKMFKSKDLLGSFGVLASGSRSSAISAYRASQRSLLRSPVSQKAISGASISGPSGGFKRIQKRMEILKANRGATAASAGRAVWHGTEAGKTPQARAGLRKGLQQYFWPSAGPQSYWSGTKYGNVSTKDVGLTKLRRTGGAALAAWSGVNIVRPGDNVGPF